MKSESGIPTKVGADKLWGLGYKGAGISIAIIDSGIKKKTSFERNILEEKDFSEKNKIRHNNNWHGNLMAESALAIAPEAKVGIFKVTDEYQRPYKKAVLEALNYCINEFPKYRIVNLSLSFPSDNCPEKCELCNLVETAYIKGILVTIAAGNKGYIEGVNTITCPGNAYWALTSIATLSKFQIDFLDNMGWLKKAIWDATGKMKKDYGTSFSSAYSAGYAALVFSAFPKLTADTYRHFALSVMIEKRKQGIETLKVDDVYNELLRIKEFKESSMAIISKPGALHPFVEDY